MEPIELAIYVTPNTIGIDVPAYQTEGAAGFDLQAHVARPIMLPPKDWRLIQTGLFMAIPQGYEGQIRPRSGLAVKYGVTVLNAPATIDSDYRGEVGVILINNSNAPVQINPGDRIAQMVIAAVTRVPISKADHISHLPETVRGSGGFGSTGQ